MKIKYWCVVLSVALTGTMPAAAPAFALDAQVKAQDVRKLDIMLMVSALRCRHGSDDFQREYEQFSTRHLPTLNDAYRTLHSQLAGQHGQTGAKRALDRLSVGMANRYGQGHPWMSCGELKALTRDLASKPAGHDLHPTAVALLAERGSGRTFLAARR